MGRYWNGLSLIISKYTKYKSNFQSVTCRDTSLHCNSRSTDQSPRRRCSWFCCPQWGPGSGRRRIPCWPFHDHLHDPQAWHHLVHEIHSRIEFCRGDVCRCRQQMFLSGDYCILDMPFVFGLIDSCSWWHFQYLSYLCSAAFRIVMLLWCACDTYCSDSRIPLLGFSWRLFFLLLFWVFYFFLPCFSF